MPWFEEGIPKAPSARPEKDETPLLGRDSGSKGTKTLSDGTSLIAESIILPTRRRNMYWRTGPPCFAMRLAVSTVSHVRSLGESKARSGTQWADATSAADGFNGGVTLAVCMKMKGHKTIKGTRPNVVATILSGKLPAGRHSAVFRSNPTSSRVSRIAAATSDSSSGSRFPPGRAM